MAADLSKLYDELGKSYQDLEAVNHIPEEPKILIKSDFEGTPITTYEHFKDVMLLEEESFTENIFSWIESNSSENGGKRKN